MEGGFSVAVLIMALVVPAMLHGSWAQTTHVVGDSLGWLVPPGGDVAYRTWAASTTFSVGDVLVFNYSSGMHDVAEVSRDAYESCNSSSPISLSTDGPTRISLTSAGEHHFICTFSSHCDLGQRLAINVSSSAPAPSPATVPSPQPATMTPPPATSPSPAVAATPPPAATPSPSPSPSRSVGMTHIVGDGLGWLVPPGGPIAYETWARTTTFMVGDILVFNFTNGSHDVLEVTRSEFESCNISTTTTTPITTGPTRITLTSAGEHHYICTFPQHCSFGQRLAINVTAGSTGSNPPPVTPPPPESNSAPSFVIGFLPFTFLAVALAPFLFN